MAGTVDGGTIHASSAHLRRGDRFLQMYTGNPWTQGGFHALDDEERRGRGHGYGIRLVEQLLDGFVSAAPPTLTTPPLRFSGERLELDVDMAAMGQAQVGVRDEAGLPLPGFELARCRRVMDDVRHAVSWDGAPSLGHAGRPIRLHFSMRSAKLYAFQFR